VFQLCDPLNGGSTGEGTAEAKVNISSHTIERGDIFRSKISVCMPTAVYVKQAVVSEVNMFAIAGS
jgi:hypothetical protein